MVYPNTAPVGDESVAEDEKEKADEREKVGSDVDLEESVDISKTQPKGWMCHYMVAGVLYMCACSGESECSSSSGQKRGLSGSEEGSHR